MTPVPLFLTMPVALVGLALMSTYHLYKLLIRRQIPSLLCAVSPVFAIVQVVREAALGDDTPLFVLLASLFALAGCVTIIVYEEAREYPWR